MPDSIAAMLLDFWFADRLRPQCFNASPELDRQIIARFGAFRIAIWHWDAAPRRRIGVI